jgi:hypothetical protein
MRLSSSMKGLLALILVGGGIGSLVLAMGGGGGEMTAPPPASTPMAATMMRVDLGADRLAAAGVTSQATTIAIDAAIAKVAQVALESADAAYAAARPPCDALERKIQSGLGSAEDVTAYQQASAQLASATAARKAALDEVFTTGVAGLPSEQRTLLTTIRANASWKLPVQYLAVNRSEGDWVKLRDYLDARRIYQADGEEVPAEVTSFLASVESNPTVSKAKADLEASLPLVQTAWNAAVTD